MDRRSFIRLPLGAAAVAIYGGEASSDGQVPRSPPSVLGRPEVGSVLIAKPAQWNVTRTPDRPVPVRRSQWMRNGKAIPGATEFLYEISPADEGARLAFRETLVEPLPGGEATSAETAAIAKSSLRRIDVTSLGLKSSRTTGSIKNGSVELVVASKDGFAIGDQIIVETGREAGRGVRGTRGVGGTWPSRSYPTDRERDADRAAPSGTYAWIESNGSVHVFKDGKWAAHDPNDYYWSAAQPLALVAKIKAIRNNTLTLDKPAAADVEGASVYFDNWPLMPRLFNATGPDRHRYTLDNSVALFPEGTFAFSNTLETNSVDGLTIAGAGKEKTVLKSPMGVPSIALRFLNGKDCHIRDLHMLGNVRDVGYGLTWRSDTGLNRNWSFTRALLFSRCMYSTARNVKVTNPWTNAVGTQQSQDIWAQNVDCLSEGHRVYIQWMFQWADSQGGGAIDCSVKSKFMTGGFEAFRSTGVTFVRPVGLNAAVAMNSSGDWLIDRATLTVTSNAQMSEQSWASRKPIVDINSNIQPPDRTIILGGELRGPTIVQKDYINRQRESYTAVIIGPHNPNVLVSGGYPEHPDRGGLIDAPDYGLLGGNGPRGIASDGDAVVDGIRVTGASNPRPGNQANNINFANARTGKGTVRNCVANTILAAHQANNQTNFQFIASPRQSRTK